MSGDRGVPRVSVTIPCYESHETVAGCLEGLRRQTWRDFDVTVVDSTPGGRSADIAAGFGGVRVVRSPRRLLPHAARNLAVASCEGELLVFTDPDVYAEPTWLERLVATHDASPGPVVGAIDCWGERWLDHGIHLCKFAKFLSGGPPRELDTAPTASFLLPRAVFDGLGGFREDLFLGDHELSTRLLSRGFTIRFEPSAVVHHHHTSTLGGFLGERYRRGRLFGRFRLADLDGARAAVYLVVTVVPIRLARILSLTVGHAVRSGRVGVLTATLPVVMAGHLWSLAGEARAYGAAVLGLRCRDGACTSTEPRRHGLTAPPP